MKDATTKIKERVERLHKINKQALNLVGETSEKLFDLVETLAEKEIERDPMNFIKNES